MNARDAATVRRIKAADMWLDGPYMEGPPYTLRPDYPSARRLFWRRSWNVGRLAIVVRPLILRYVWPVRCERCGLLVGWRVCGIGRLVRLAGRLAWPLVPIRRARWSERVGWCLPLSVGGCNLPDRA